MSFYHRHINPDAAPKGDPLDRKICELLGDDVFISTRIVVSDLDDLELAKKNEDFVHQIRMLVEAECRRAASMERRLIDRAVKRVEDGVKR